MIYCSHGIVANRKENLHCHRYLLDREQFKRYITDKSNKYVSLQDALEWKGDAFTIDDSTYAALEAAKLLREYEHHVTIFINPYYIEKNTPYWFSMISHILDTRTYDGIYLEGRYYSCVTYQERLKFRRRLKNIISLFATEEERDSYLSGIFDIDLKKIEVPLSVRSLTKEDILQLQEIGVDIQNHGWSHRQLNDAATTEEIVNEVSKGKNWLLRELNIVSDYYAVPFGKLIPPKGYDFSELKCWFLIDNSLASGFISNKVYNRSALNINALN